MKTNFPTRDIIYGVLSVLLLASCTKVDTGPSGQSDGKVRISFSAPVITEEVVTPQASQAANKSAAQPATRAVLTEKTTVRVVAYTTTNPTYSGEQAYFMDSDGKLKPCTVNDDGTFKAVDTENELALYPGVYDFYAHTPAVPLGADKKTVTVPNGVDYASSLTSNITVAANMTLPLTSLDRKCSKIALVVKTATDNPQMTNLAVAANGVTISTLPATITIGLNEPIAPVSGTATLTVPQTAFAAAGSSTTESSAITYLLPRLGENRINLTYNLTYTISGALGGTETKDISGSMGDIALESGKSYTFTLTIRQSGASLVVTEWIDGGTQDVEMGEGFDYSIDGSSGFMIAGRDMKNPIDGSEKMNWYVANGVIDATYNPTGARACPNGWRLPTQQEMALLSVYHSTVPAKFSFNSSSFYWSAADHPSDKSFSWLADLSSGYITVQKKTNLNLVRCVRDVTPQAGSAQMVVASGDRVVIDSRSVRPSGITETRKARTTKWVDDSSPAASGLDDIASAESNAQAYYYFEVAKTDANGGNGLPWLDAVNTCASSTDDGGGWRLPTLRELELMYVLKAKLVHISSAFNSFNNNPYWSATESGKYDSYTCSLYVHFSSGETLPLAIPNQAPIYVRCVRDVTPPARVVVDGDRVVIDSRNVGPEWITKTKKARTTKWVDDSSPAASGLDDIASAESDAQAYYYFEVAKTDANGGNKLAWLDAVNTCASSTDDGGGWRLPTLRESMIMSGLRPELLNSRPDFGSFDPSAYYWSATEGGWEGNTEGGWEGNTEGGWFISLFNGSTDNYYKTDQYGVRCIRDLTPAAK